MNRAGATAASSMAAQATSALSFAVRSMRAATFAAMSGHAPKLAAGERLPAGTGHAGAAWPRLDAGEFSARHVPGRACIARSAWRIAAAWLCAACLAGCASLAQKAADDFAANLGKAVLDQDDPATVRDGLPAYLLLLDAMVAGNPRSAGANRAAADLYASYAGSFVSDPARAAVLAARAQRYARAATCLDAPRLCAALDRPYDEFAPQVAAGTDIAVLYSLGGAWAAWVQTHSDDFAAIADIPKVEALLQRVVELDPGHDRGLPWVYLGVLNSLRPEAVGGKPEAGRAAFERAIEASKGRNLFAKTLFARWYARLVFDRDLHDRLLNEVIAADPRAEGFTLINTLAQQQARELLATSKDYF